MLLSQSQDLNFCSLRCLEFIISLLNRSVIGVVSWRRRANGEFSEDLHCAVANWPFLGMNDGASGESLWVSKVYLLRRSTTRAIVICARWTLPARCVTAADVEKYVLKKFFMLEPEESVTVSGSRHTNNIRGSCKGWKNGSGNANILFCN